MTLSAAGVYEQAAADWAAGPEAVYALLADALVRTLPRNLNGLRCLDLGAGTGVASRLLVDRGASVTAVDISWPMLRWQRGDRPPAVVGDAERLPLAAESQDVVVAAFCLNHLEDPAVAFGEVRRVLTPGGRALVSTWARSTGDDELKQTAERVLRSYGWQPPDWYVALRAVENAASDVDAMASRARGAGLRADVRAVTVDLDLGAEALAEWRLRMPHTSSWLAGLPPAAVSRVRADVRGALDAQRWSTRMLVLDGRRVA